MKNCKENERTYKHMKGKGNERKTTGKMSGIRNRKQRAEEEKGQGVDYYSKVFAGVSIKK